MNTIGVRGTPAKANKMHIQLYNYMNSGWVVYDDVELYKIVNGNRSGGNLAPNPGFENTANWIENGFSAYTGTSFYRSSWGTAVPHGGSYAYSYGNPVKYIDPSGHLSCSAEHVAEGDCSDVTITDLIGEYNVTVSGDWKPLEIWNLLQALDAMGSKLADSMGGNLTSTEAFISVYDTMEFNMWDGQCSDGCWGRSLGAHEIRLYRHYTYTDPLDNNYILDTKIREQLVVHELGHSLEFAITEAGGKAPNTYLSTDMTANRAGLNPKLWVWQQSKDISATEIFADMVIGWVYDVWYTGNDPVSRNLAEDRQNFMNLYMPIWLQINFP